MFYPYGKTEVNQQRFEAVTASDIYASAVKYAFTGELSQESADSFDEGLPGYASRSDKKLKDGDNVHYDGYSW